MERLGAQHYRIEYYLHDSITWRYEISRLARELYCQLKARRNRIDKDGNLINISDKEIEFGYSDSFGVSKPSFVKGIEELRMKGLIKLVKPGKLPKIKAVYALSNKWKVYERSLKYSGQYTEGERRQIQDELSDGQSEGCHNTPDNEE